jgi:hypothetical protein
MKTDLLSQYQAYDQGFKPQQSRPQPNTANRIGTGLQAAGAGAMAINPYVGAGLEAAGLLANLYGNYQASEDADRQYAQQMAEYNDVKYYDRKRAEEEARRQAMFDSANYAQGDQNSRLARYASYNRGINL